MHGPPATAATVDGTSASLAPAESALRTLVRAAAVVAVGDEPAIRAALAECARDCDPEWVEEMVLQSYLFAGFPRALNAMREWRRIARRPAPTADADGASRGADAWTTRGEATCAAVYGPFYDRLRHNIAALHPALDDWMIAEGYGKVLGRPVLPLAVRELCVVAVCAAARQDRQLHSHLHGALHVGAPAAAVTATLHAVADLMPAEAHDDALRLWAHVQTAQAARAPRAVAGTV